jgi:hypothetical protein
MRRYGVLGLTLGVFLALGGTLASGSSSPRALADEGCGPHSLRGGYGFAFQGQVVPPGVAELDIGGAGRVVFDGHGGISGREWASTNGQPETLTFTGGYTVAPDCTGTITIVNSNGRTDRGKIALVEGGQEVNFIETDPGVVLTLHLSRQSISGCTNRSLSGVFNASQSGSAFNPAGVEQGDVSLFITLHFDGRGHESGSSTASFNGFPASDTFTGTYQVNPDCTGSATDTFTSGQPEGHVKFVLVERGNEIKFIAADPGTVFAGTVDRMASSQDSGGNNGGN